MFNFRRYSDKFYGDIYRRSVSGRAEGVSLELVPGAGYICLGPPDISLRLDEVEDFVFRFEKPGPVPVTIVDARRRSTLGFRMEPPGIWGLFAKRWRISNETDAIKAAKEFVPRAMKRAELFWRQFSDCEEVFRELMKDGEAGRKLGGPDHFRAQRAIALGFLMYGPERARRIAEAKLPGLRNEEHKETKEWAERALGNPPE